jgi:hypothetical protein
MRSRIRVRLTLEALQGTETRLIGIFERASPALRATYALKLFEEILLRVSRGPEGLWREPEALESESPGWRSR